LRWHCIMSLSSAAASAQRLDVAPQLPRQVLSPVAMPMLP